MSEQMSERHMTTAELAGISKQNNGDGGAAQMGSDAASNQAEMRSAANPQDIRPTPLLPSGETNDMRARWSAIQIGFVDDPRHAVEMADTLVAETMQRLAQVFASQRGQLEGQWSRGQDVSTEDLRQALRQYRSFFDRLLSI